MLYYSNNILSKTLPDLGPYVSLAITFVNTIMTFPPIFLIEVLILKYSKIHVVLMIIFFQKLGRKRLLQISVLGSIISLLTLGYGLNTGTSSMSSVSIIVFVM